MALIFASLHFDAKRPVSHDVLNIIESSFSIFTPTESGPDDLLLFKSLSFFSMVAASKLITSLLSAKGFYSIFHVFSPSIVKTLLNCDANAPVL